MSTKTKKPFYNAKLVLYSEFLNGELIVKQRSFGLDSYGLAKARVFIRGMQELGKFNIREHLIKK